MTSPAPQCHTGAKRGLRPRYSSSSATCPRCCLCPSCACWMPSPTRSLRNRQTLQTLLRLRRMGSNALPQPCLGDWPKAHRMYHIITVWHVGVVCRLATHHTNKTQCGNVWDNHIRYCACWHRFERFLFSINPSQIKTSESLEGT